MLKILKKINNYYVRLPKIIGAPPALQHSWALELPIQMYSDTGTGTFQLSVLTITGIQILLCCLLQVFGISNNNQDQNQACKNAGKNEFNRKIIPVQIIE